VSGDKEKSLACFRGTSLSSRHLRHCSLHVNTTGVCNQMHATSATRGAKKLPVTACAPCMTHAHMHVPDLCHCFTHQACCQCTQASKMHIAPYGMRAFAAGYLAHRHRACERRCRSFVVPQQCMHAAICPVTVTTPFWLFPPFTYSNTLHT
jgi:hypothetical protein